MVKTTGLQIILPKKKAKAGGQTATPTYNPTNDVLSLPRYRDHLTDLFATRTANDSRTLMNDLSRHDSDVSAAFFAYQSIAGSADWVIKAYDINGELSSDGIRLANQIIDQVTITNDYTLGFSAKLGFNELNDDLRFFTLLRGSPGAELVLNKSFEPDRIRLVDMSTIEWREKSAGEYKPIQKPAGANIEINLDIPTFFTARFHQNPTDQYSYSTFVAAINTVASRQQVINELYRITQIVGYPRMDVKVLEEVILRSAPAILRSDANKVREFVDQQMSQIRTAFQNLQANQALVHTDSVEVKMVNDARPATSLPIQNVIDVLNEQNQAALKTMPAVVGKGGSGQVASVEARLFALNCDALNRVAATIWSQILTLATRLAGFQGSVELAFLPVELRPALELEAQKTMRQTRYENALSRGYITDDEFHIDVFGRPKPASSPDLSGTNFMNPVDTLSMDTEGVTPNTDSLGRSLTGEGGSKAARSNTSKQ